MTTLQPASRSALGPPDAPPWTFPVLAVTLTVLTAAINAQVGGNPVVALLPTLLLAALWATWRLPLRITFSLLLFMALVLDNPAERPQQDRWHSFLYAPGQMLYLNLHNMTGIGALRFSLLEVLLVILCMVAVAREWTGSSVDADPAEGSARPLRQALVVYLVALAGFAVWGLVRGGDTTQTLWQLRELAWLPVLAFLGMRAFRTRSDLWRLAAVVIAAALIRATVGIYYYFIICRPQSIVPDFVTTHGDSVLFGLAFMLPVLCLLERPGVFSAVVSAVILPPVGLALVLNNRRLAFVSLFICLVTVVFSIRRSVKVVLFRMMVLSLPLAAVYVAAGWNSTAPVFAPINRLRSAADPNNTSNQTRDIENGNLIITFYQNPLVGSGFGHEYIERVKAFDIAQAFPQYRYIAHNSVLWLWSVTGMVGFTLLWMPFLVGVFLAVRSYQRASTTTQRVASMATLAALVCYFGQAYGDMGLQSWTGTLVLSAWLGACGRLAVVTQAWPERLSFHVTSLAGSARLPRGVRVPTVEPARW